MSDPTLQAHLTAIDATQELLRVQIAGLRHHLETREREAASVKGAGVDLPARCAGIEPRACALLDDDNRIDAASFGQPNRWKCRGCGYDSAGESHGSGPEGER